MHEHYGVPDTGDPNIKKLKNVQKFTRMSTSGLTEYT